MTADILLINGHIGNVKSLPTGLLGLAAVLREQGFTVALHDYQLCSEPRKPDPETLFRFVPTDAPVVGVSAMCNSLPTVLGAIERLKQERPWQTVILGGPAATDTPGPIVERFPVDVIVRGEGEATLAELMPLLAVGAPRERLEQVAGISFRNGRRVVHTPPRRRIQNLDSLPVPAYDLVNLAHYDGVLPVVAVRGCPYECAFCSAHSIWERRLTSRSPAHIAAEVRAWQGRARQVDFHDDTFTLNRSRVRAIIRALRKRGVHLPWSCNARVNLMTESYIEEMAALGCSEIFYGIESGSNRVLARIAKQITIDQARRTVAKTARSMKGVVTSYIWGYPFETVDDLYETLMSVADDLRTPGVRPQVGLLAPLPRSPLKNSPYVRLRFDPAFVSPAIFPATDSLGGYPQLITMIRSHPNLFSAFYHFDHPELEAKRAMLDRLVVS
jgi:radical SAM superfamily enzyme YgiQ (UPF0313 family)